MALTTIDPALQNTQSQYTGFKNRIINGAMTIDQRNVGASVTPTSSNTYSLDRWNTILTQASKFSIQQNAGSVTPPVGFTKYLGITSLSAYSVGAGDAFSQIQYIEGQNIADFAWGTASAATVTLSFWVRSSLTGTFGGSLRNSAGNRSYPFSYTISSANTWEQKSITIAGDQSGTWATDNSIGIGVQFGLGSGATYSGTSGAWASGLYIQPTSTISVVGTNAATWYITGVQLEKGSTATSFDYRPYGTELQLCQRYFTYIGGVASGFPLFQLDAVTINVKDCPISFPVRMRASPTATKSGTWATSNCGQPTARFISSDGYSFSLTPSGAGNVVSYPDSTDDIITFSAEL